MGLTKKLVGVALAATMAAQLWSGMSNAGKKIVSDVRKLEVKYRAALRLTEVEP